MKNVEKTRNRIELQHQTLSNKCEKCRYVKRPLQTTIKLTLLSFTYFGGSVLAEDVPELLAALLLLPRRAGGLCLRPGGRHHDDRVDGDDGVPGQVGGARGGPQRGALELKGDGAAAVHRQVEPEEKCL